ncbi:glycolate oxidase subunit GlcE [Falsiroseomonas stagni]|uniref:Glycolate oxidase FAD binding subunit n=1 Tax=Falsiroseomonas stagni DSM 19981 TaxID=1123062 RepID=A0A1I4BY45_9PROT|nr:glycolate oxidase subunit GlcE [Falsiroseomonas stagni]SFK73019.1 glycolate oxidase FAD binding subunit [Falsiroseomonas stagni DSM 19981]
MNAPDTEAGIVAAVLAARVPLAIEGNGSKRGLLRPVQAAETLSTRNLSGITLYKPTEMVLSARAGTTLPEIEAVLAERGQMLAPEPIDVRAIFGGTQPATLGGTVATNLSGPRRINAGSVRDHLLGIRFVNGKGEVVRSGGRVLKNVTGLDLCKLLAGSHGTLGVLTEITMKVLPATEATATLKVSVPDLAAGIRALSAGLTSPYGVTGAALLPDSLTALLRLEDFSESVTYRSGRLRADLEKLGGVTLVEGDESRALWRQIRDAEPLAAAPDDAIWRLSVRPSAAPALVASLAQAFGARTLLDWGGGLVWVAGPATEAAHQAVVAATQAARGSHTLFRAPEPLRAAVAVIPDEAPALAAIAARVKAALDPAGLFNPGRMRAGT